MENNQNSTARIHPLVGTAAVSLILLSAAGIAAITGVLPKSRANLPEHSVIAPAASATTAAPGGITFQIPAAVPAPVPAPAPKPVVKKAPRPVVQARAKEPVREYGPEDFARGQQPQQSQQPVVLAQAPASQPQAQPQYQPQYQPQPVAQSRCFDCGTVASVKEIAQKGEGSWIGPVAGGVGGAILGKQMGKGNGNTIMTILGAAGGAYAGNQIEKHVRTTKRWEVVVRLEDGSTRSVSYPTQPAWQVGDRVFMNNGTLEPERRS